MRQKDNKTGVLNTVVSRPVLARMKAVAQQEGRTLQWTVEKACLLYVESLDPKETVADAQEVPINGTKTVKVECAVCHGRTTVHNAKTDSYVACPVCGVDE